jgi:hypothetical protein
VWSRVLMGEVTEHSPRQKAAKASSECSLTIEESQALAELITCIPETQI